MKLQSDLPAKLAALLGLSMKTLLQTLLVVCVLRLTRVLPFVPIFDFHIRSESPTPPKQGEVIGEVNIAEISIDELTTKQINQLGERLMREGFGPAPPPPNYDENSENLIPDIFRDPPEELPTPSPSDLRTLNARPQAEATKSFFTESDLLKRKLGY